MENLKHLVNSQIERLKRLGCPGNILGPLHDKRKMVIARAEQMGDNLGNIPFLPVIPTGKSGFDKLLGMLGCKFINDLDTIIPCSTFRPYFLVGVNDGSQLINKSASQAKRILDGQGRKLLTAEEVIAMCLHYGNRDYMLDCGATTICCERIIPVIYKRGGTIIFDWRVPKDITLWGTPSCQGRI